MDMYERKVSIKSNIATCSNCDKVILNETLIISFWKCSTSQTYILHAGFYLSLD